MYTQCQGYRSAQQVIHSYNGTLLWKIESYQRKRQDAINRVKTIIAFRPIMAFIRVTAADDAPQFKTDGKYGCTGRGRKWTILLHWSRVLSKPSLKALGTSHVS